MARLAQSAGVMKTSHASTPGDDFDAAKKNADSQLDTLEHLVDTAGKEVDTFK